MIDNNITGTARSALHLPLQAAPIDRSQSSAAAMVADGGVEADLFGLSLPSWVDDVVDAVKTYGPAVAAGLSAVSDRRLKTDVVPVAWGR